MKIGKINDIALLLFNSIQIFDKVWHECINFKTCIISGIKKIATKNKSTIVFCGSINIFPNLLLKF